MNKELHLVLDAMFRQARLSLRGTEKVAPFAAIMTLQGKTSVLLGPARPGGSPQMAMRALEAGLRAQIGQGLSKAVGTCSGTAISTELSRIGAEVLDMFLEHTDGTAYRISMHYSHGRLGEIGQAVIVAGKPQFLLKVMTRSA